MLVRSSRSLASSLFAVAAVAWRPPQPLTRRFATSEDDECLVIRFVTGNEGKLREATAILEEHGLPLPLSMCELDLEELQSNVPEKIAAAKCELAAQITGGPVLVDDTSLCLEALGGMPGPFIKWFDKADVLVKMLHGFDSKRAYAQSCVAFSIGPGTVPLVFTGRAYGEICEPQGDRGFAPAGWDQCFRPDGANLTFAQMNMAQKNKISHRAQALIALSRYLTDHSELLIRLCGDYVQEPRDPPPDVTFHRRREQV